MFKSKILYKMKIRDHGIYPLLMQKSYPKLFLGIKMISADPFSICFAGSICDKSGILMLTKIFLLPSNSQKIIFENLLSDVRFYTLAFETSLLLKTAITLISLGICWVFFMYFQVFKYHPQPVSTPNLLVRDWGTMTD